jgi:hypothetical protein
MKIKIIAYFGDYDSGDMEYAAVRDITTWDEVSDEDYQKLLGWVQMQNRKAVYPRYVMFVQERLNYKNCINDYLEYIKEEEKKAIAAKAKKESDARLKKALRDKKSAESELKLIQDLAKKHGIDIVGPDVKELPFVKTKIKPKND